MSPSRQAQGLIDAAKLNNMQVTDLQGQSLGSIRQILIDPQTGRIRYAVIHTGPETDVAVPWMAFNVNKDASGPKLALDATKQKLDSAPKFSAGDADRLFTKEAAEPIYNYWAIVWVEEPSPVGEASPAPGTSPSMASPAPSAGTTPGSTP